MCFSPALHLNLMSAVFPDVPEPKSKLSINEVSMTIDNGGETGFSLRSLPLIVPNSSAILEGAAKLPIQSMRQKVASICLSVTRGVRTVLTPMGRNSK